MFNFLNRFLCYGVLLALFTLWRLDLFGNKTNHLKKSRFEIKFHGCFIKHKEITEDFQVRFGPRPFFRRELPFKPNRTSEGLRILEIKLEKIS
jgi:hypothetical protein